MEWFDCWPGLASTQLIFPTPVLRHMVQRRRLDHLCSELPRSFLWNHRQLKALAHAQAPQAWQPDAAQALIAAGFAVSAAGQSQQVALPFVFVTAVNLELTYGCNLACTHCLQGAMRPKASDVRWLNLDLICTLLHEAEWLGLLSLGLNLTGGEVFAPQSPLLDVLAEVQQRGIRTRVNTNAWWGHGRQLQIGSQLFERDLDVIKTLQALGLGRLALSLDNRYAQYPDLLEKVVRVASLCEQQDQAYEFVITSTDQAVWDQVLVALQDAIGGSPQILKLTPMDEVDLGAAAARSTTPVDAQQLPGLIQASPCGGQGFHRPYYLHVTPEGGVRSCLYGPSGEWLGHLGRQSIREILNAAATNPVCQLFEQQAYKAFVDRWLEPWQHLYQGLRHPCAASAVVAILAGEILPLVGCDQEPISAQTIEAIHQRVAGSLGLTAAP